MANPRQRKKQRSSRVKLTRRTADRQKKVNIRANPIIAAAWDKTATLSQNYKRLGLVANPNKTSSGGVEKLFPDPPRPEQQADQNGLKPGEALIKRDAEGNVIDIIYGKATQDAEMADVEKTEVIKALEARASEESKTPREASIGEVSWLKQIVAKYGDDMDRASRDRKLNPMQQSPGDLRKRVKGMQSKK